MRESRLMTANVHVFVVKDICETLRIVSQMGQVFGEEEYSDYCEGLARDVKDAFNEAYLINIPGTDFRFYGSQTATVMALKFGMVPEDKVESVVAGLVHDIEVTHKGHHTVGIHGLRHIYTVLADFGHGDLVARMLLDRSFPGPGYLADHGFSTWPERQFNWDKEPRYRNSMNHPMQGGFAAFFYEGVGGIRPSADAVGYRKTLLRPRLVEDLDWANTSMELGYGRVRSDWKRSGEGLAWEVEVPVNTTAVAYLPAAVADAVTESGKALSEAPGVLGIQRVFDANRPSIEVTLGSGRYEFLVRSID